MAAEAGRLSSRVRANETIGRFRRVGLQAFEADEVAYVASHGFDVNVD